jgi:hypothetical protein
VALSALKLVGFSGGVENVWASHNVTTLITTVERTLIVVPPGVY